MAFSIFTHVKTRKIIKMLSTRQEPNSWLTKSWKIDWTKFLPTVWQPFRMLNLQWQLTLHSSNTSAGFRANWPIRAHCRQYPGYQTLKLTPQRSTIWTDNCRIWHLWFRRSCLSHMHPLLASQLRWYRLHPYLRWRLCFRHLSRPTRFQLISLRCSCRQLSALTVARLLERCTVRQWMAPVKLWVGHLVYPISRPWF